MPLISIITPAYNAEPFIATAIKSMEAQTVSDWEMIIVDDGSIDDTRGVVRAFVKHDPRVKYSRLEKNSGDATALNAALGLVSPESKYIARQDADDWSDPRRLGKQLSAMRLAEQMTRGVFNIVTCGMVRVMSPALMYTNVVTGMDPIDYLITRCPSGPCVGSVFANREAFALVGHYSSIWRWSCDSDWNFRAIQHRCNWHHVKEDLYFYRDHSQQMTKRARTGNGDEMLVEFHRQQELYRPLIQRDETLSDE